MMPRVWDDQGITGWGSLCLMARQFCRNDIKDVDTDIAWGVGVRGCKSIYHSAQGSGLCISFHAAFAGNGRQTLYLLYYNAWNWLCGQRHQHFMSQVGT